jgi:hypothetical protein
MAPFCEHDCMHTHWRWGQAFKGHPAVTIQQPLMGFGAVAEPRFAGTGKPCQHIGEALIPLNQDLDVAFGSNSQLEYAATLGNIAPGVWQPVYHHGSAYVLGFSADGGPKYALAKLYIGGSSESSELYWNMRYQATTDGALERVVLDPYDLQRAMVAASTLRLHLKVFDEPVAVSLETMVARARGLLALHGIDLVEASRETFSDEASERFRTLVIDNTVPTDDQMSLFALRGEVPADELVVYVVRTLVPAQAGCAVHPTERPGAVVSATLATEWTLAHQIGHVLGLAHVEGSNRLMTSRATSTIEAPVPEIGLAESAVMMSSPFVGV